MEETNSDIKVVVVVVQHPVLGVLLTPYTAKDMPDGTTLLLEQAFHASRSTLSQVGKVYQTIVDIASRFAEKNLMKVYSKEKTVNAFLKKLDEKVFQTTIRPFIEKKIVEMVELIQQYNIPVFQNKTGNKTLYPHSAYQVSSSITNICYTFEANEKHFSYGLTCYRNGEEISLLDKKPVITLTSSPAILLIGNELHVFHNIQATRILPFTNKAIVTTDVSQVNKYMENIVLPIARYHEIRYSGLPIFEEQRKCEARLNIENSIYDTPVLQLLFAYGDIEFYPGKEFNAKYAFAIDKNERKEIYYFYRNQKKEEEAKRKLREAGLQLLNDCYYNLRDDSEASDLTEWISRNKAMLKNDFRLMNNEKGADYCLDDITVEQDVSETNDWFELRITVVIGDFRIPFIRFRKNILSGNRDYLLPDGRIILLPEEWFIKFADILEFSEKEESAIRLKRSYVGIVQEFLDTDKRKAFSYQEKEYIEPPKELKATLRKYQKEGFNWMMHLYRNHLGGCLADDMGLGKTLQTLTLLQTIYSGSKVERLTAATSVDADETGQFSLFNYSGESTVPASLIVVPTSLLHNWKREISKFTTLSVYEYTGGSHQKGYRMEQLFGNFQIILTSYGIMRNYSDAINRYAFECIVLDESQNIKNSDSLTFRAAMALQGKYKLILTGTPIENSLKDLWSQFHFLQPELLGTESYYQKNYITPIKQGNKQTENRLLKLISPFILRRSKQEVAPELPSLTEEVLFCDMTDEQKDIYQKEKNSLRNLLLEDNTRKSSRNSLTVLNGIMLLRQLACHPLMVNPDFTGTSGKLEEIISTYETLRSEGHKVLIFSSFVKHLDIIAAAFTRHGWDYAMLTGSTVRREEEIEHFNQSDETGAFLISLKAGGVGLNLTQADYVFIIDPWWNPAAEMQAISRAHRIGQNKHVIAYRFITQGSIEEKIIHLQEYKRRLSETFITESNPFESLNDDEWAELIE